MIQDQLGATCPPNPPHTLLQRQNSFRCSDLRLYMQYSCNGLHEMDQANQASNAEPPITCFGYSYVHYWHPSTGSAPR